MTGGYLLTQKEVFFDRARACQLIAAIMAQNDQNINIQLPPPAIIKVPQSVIIKVPQSVIIKVPQSVIIKVAQSVIIKVPQSVSSLARSLQAGSGQCTCTIERRTNHSTGSQYTHARISVCSRVACGRASRSSA